jgi:lipopolysaccharide export LptBFGC system permease protein LptF
LRGLDWFLLKTFLPLVIMGLLLFSVVWFAPETLLKLVQAALVGTLPWGEFFRLTFLYQPEVLLQSIPITALVASTLGMRRLSQDFELIALYNAGIGPMRLGVCLLLIALGLGGLLWALQEWVVPQTHPILAAKRIAYGLADAPKQNFVFYDRKEGASSGDSSLFVAAKASPAHCEAVYWLFFRPKATPEQDVLKTIHSSISRIIQAKEAHWNPSTQSWELKQGQVHEIDRQGVYRHSEAFQAQRVRGVPAMQSLIRYSQLDRSHLSAGQTQQYLRLLEAAQQVQELPFFRLRFAQKCLAPLTVIAFFILGCYLGPEPPRQRRSVSLLVAAACLFVYFVATPLLSQLALLTLIPVSVAAWLPLALALFMAYPLKRFLTPLLKG